MGAGAGNCVAKKGEKGQQALLALRNSRTGTTERCIPNAGWNPEASIRISVWEGKEKLYLQSG